MGDSYKLEDVDNAWCPGCGNFGILTLIDEVLQELQADKKNVVVVSGIGQAAKTPHYLDLHMFNGLHGRALPIATAVKASNPNLIVIAEGGDGDMYGEGGNHFINTIRRNVNIVHLVHNNMIYGLTKGQASPTSQKQLKTGVQVNGVFNEPFNPLSLALSLDASFISRVSIGSYEHAKEVLKKAFLHKGYSLVDIFQPCVTFNKINTYDWFDKHTYKIEDAYDVEDKNQAWQKANETQKFPLGILYQKEKVTFEEFLWEHQDEKPPLYNKTHDLEFLQEKLEQF